MTKIRNFIPWLCALLLTISMLAFCACTNLNESNENTRTITDCYGREVLVPQNVNKIATVGSATRLVVYAGATDKLIAVTEMDKPSELRPYTLASENKTSSLPTTNNGNHINSTTIDEEKMLNLNPDVILSSRNAEECDKLQNEIKIPVVGVYFQDEIFSENVKNCIKITGEVADTQKTANDTIKYLEDIESEISSKCSGNTDSIYRGAINYKGSKDLTGTISKYCIYQALKANSVSDKENINGAYDTSLEQILSWNPNYVVMDYSNKEKVKNQINSNSAVFDKLDAFKNNQTFFVASFNNNGTNLEYALCELYLTAKILYPDKFTDTNLEEKYSEIFTHILHADIYQEILNRGVIIGSAKF